jgi:hypothetical protein
VSHLLHPDPRARVHWGKMRPNVKYRQALAAPFTIRPTHSSGKVLKPGSTFYKMSKYQVMSNYYEGINTPKAQHGYKYKELRPQQSVNQEFHFVALKLDPQQPATRSDPVNIHQ